MRNTSFSQIKVRSGMETVLCRPNRRDDSRRRRFLDIAIIRSKLSLNPLPERVRQLYSGFYCTPDLEQKTGLRNDRYSRRRHETESIPLTEYFPFRVFSSNSGHSLSRFSVPNPECNKIRSKVGERALGADLTKVYSGL